MHITRLGGGEGSVPRSSFQNGKFSREKKGDQMDQVK